MNVRLSLLRFLPLLLGTMIPVTSVLALDDSFDRADTSFLEYTNDDDGLGNGWRPVSGTWRIGDNKLELKAPGIVSRVILLAEPKLTVPFTVSVEVIALTSNREPSAGLAFFAKDAKQFYVFRICAAGPDSFLQFNATDNGEEGMQNIGGNLAAGAQFQENTPYRLTVRCTTPGTFDFTVVDVASGETLVSNSVRDPQSRFTEGQVGIYSSTAFSAFDNFSFKKE